MTYSAQMHTDSVVRDAYCVMRTRLRNTQYAIRNTRCGFTSAELLVVIVVVSLFALLAQVHLFGLLRKNTFKAQIQEFVSTMQMAARAAAQTGRIYEVIVDIAEQSYTLKHVTGSKLSYDTPGEIVVRNDFSDNCRVVHVLFDDWDFTNDSKAWFWVGHSGWAYGGKIVLVDEKEQPYSVVVNRLNRMVTLEEGDVELLEPKRKDELPF